MAKKDEKPEARIDAKAFNHVASHATIREIRLTSAKLDLKPEAVMLDEEPWAYQLFDSLDDWTCDNEARTLTGIFTYKAACVEGRRKLLSLTCRYLAKYDLSGTCDEEAGHQFLVRVGRFSAYPYFRSTFATLTQQGGVLLPPLPVITEPPRWVQAPGGKKAVATKL